MIEAKRELAERIVGTGEGWITELSTEQLREVIALSDRRSGGGLTDVFTARTRAAARPPTGPPTRVVWRRLVAAHLHPDSGGGRPAGPQPARPDR